MEKFPIAKEVLKTAEQEGEAAAAVEMIEVTATIRKMQNRSASVGVLTRYEDLSQELKNDLAEAGFKIVRAIVVDPYGKIHEGVAITL